MFLVEARNIVAYKGQGLPGIRALNFTLQLRDLACTSSRWKDVGGLWQCHHPPHFTRKAQRLYTIRRTALPSLPYKHTGTARTKKAPLVWSCCKTSRRWAGQRPSPSHTTSHVAPTSWGQQPRSRPTWIRSPDRESSATQDGERAGWKCLVSSHRTAEPGVLPSETWSTRLVMPVQPASGECWRKYKLK